MKFKRLGETQNNIIQILKHSANPLSVPQIRKEYENLYREISYIAIYLSIQSLVKRQIVTKDSKHYRLSQLGHEISKLIRRN